MSGNAVKTLAIVLQVMGGLPLIAYPAVLMASLMGIAGHTPQTITPLQRITSQFFYWGTIVYPAAPILCYLLAWKAFQQGNPVTFLGLSIVPLALLVLVAGLGVLMFSLESKRKR